MSKEGVKTITIDPRMFINEPFLPCPKCGKNSFGVLSIYGHHYSRRCRECWYSANFDLPQLNKKIIYIDQFAISEMMKVLNPDSSRTRAGTIDDFWLELFRRLDRMAKLQIIVCPDSEVHRQESMAAGKVFQDAAKRMYEQLSGGLTFYPPSWIEQIQLSEHLKAWLKGNSAQVLTLDEDTALMGDRNVWWDHLRVSIEMPTPEEWVDALGQVNKDAAQQLSAVADRWRKQPIPFNDRYLEEVHGYGKGRLKEWVEWVMSTEILDIISPPVIAMTIRSGRSAIEAEGFTGDAVEQKIIEYFSSDDLRYLPLVNIQANIYATAAAKIASGQKKPLTPSLLSDAKMLGAYLPYCDAMFLDNEMAGYVSELQRSSRIPFATKIYSRNTASDFFAYLDALEAATPKEHMDKIKEVYGDAWATPYESMYGKE